MRKFLLLTAITLLLAPAPRAQAARARPEGDEAAAVRIMLAADLHALEAESAKLDAPLERAAAGIEIADALWALDAEGAKKMLREAYNLTFPDEEGQANPRVKLSAGAAPAQWTEAEHAQNGVRARALAVAGRDKALADELAQLGARRLGSYEEQYRYSNLAERAIEAGETDAAGDYIRRSIEADPTQINAGLSILNLAARDRGAADKLILEYITRLRSVPLSRRNQSAFRVFFVLQPLVFPGSSPDPVWQRVAPPGPAVQKAYVGFVLDSLGRLEESEPGSAAMLRHVLLSAWMPLSRYAPELTPAFMHLERLSRRPGEDASLPRAGEGETRQAKYEERVKQALDGRNPDDMTIQFAIGRGDFASARKLIGMLSDEDRKAELLDLLNAREAAGLAARDDFAGAERLAARLSRAALISQVYTVLIGVCAGKKDASCAAGLAYEAVKQFKRSPDQQAVPLGLTKLARAAAPLKSTLAFELLDEAVRSANSRGGGGSRAPDSRRHLAGIDADVFRLLAAIDETRTRQAADVLKERLPRIVALAAIYQWKTKELTKGAEATVKSSAPRVRK